MPYDTDTAGGSRLSPGLDPNELERTDRILLGACAGIWLVALGSAVAATVALVDLGTAQSASAGDSETPWLLYGVIGISAIVIIGAVPLLLRARRDAMAETQPPARPAPGRPQRAPGVVEAPTEKLSAAGLAVGRRQAGPGYASAEWMPDASLPPAVAKAVDQVWLRCAIVIACAIGIATALTGVATYLMAVDSTVAAWVCYVLAALITLAMPAIPWLYLRELRATLEGRGAQSPR
jgi:hypothetical protein